MWLRVNGEVEPQSKSLLKAMRRAATRIAELSVSLRSTSHTTTGVSPAELLFGRRIRTEQLEFESTEEEGEGHGTTDHQARDQDA